MSIDIRHSTATGRCRDRGAKRPVGPGGGRGGDCRAAPRLRGAADDRRARPGGGAGRGAGPGRPLGLWQVDAAGADLRPARAERRGRRGRRRGGGGGAARALRLHAPARPPPALVLGARQRGAGAAQPRRRPARGARGRAAPVRALRPRRLRGLAPGRALRRHAPAGRLPAHPRRRQAGAGARRAVRLARRDHPRPRCRSGWPAALRADPRTAILVTHDVEEALYLSDRVAVLSARPARIVAELRAPAPRAPDRDAAVTDPSSRTSARPPCGRSMRARRRAAPDPAAPRCAPPRPALGPAGGVRRRPDRRLADRRRGRRDRRSAQPRTVLRPLPRRSRHGAVGEPRPALGKHLGDPARDPFGLGAGVLAGVALAIRMRFSPSCATPPSRWRWRPRRSRWS